MFDLEPRSPAAAALDVSTPSASAALVHSYVEQQDMSVFLTLTFFVAVHHRLKTDHHILRHNYLELLKNAVYPFGCICFPCSPSVSLSLTRLTQTAPLLHAHTVVSPCKRHHPSNAGESHEFKKVSYDPPTPPHSKFIFFHSPPL